MIEPILTYGKVRLLNVPGGKPVYDEIFVQDCYRREQIPEGSIVLDVGGFYGEFGIYCEVEKHCFVQIYEPSKTGFEVATVNIQINDTENVSVYNCAVGKDNNDRCFIFDPEHPAGSRFSDVAEPVRVPCTTLPNLIEACRTQFGHHPPLVVKLDCEGAEREIFEDESWIDSVHLLLMEFHHKDGPRYCEILARHGFTTELSDPNPESWRATIFAKKK